MFVTLFHLNNLCTVNKLKLSLCHPCPVVMATLTWYWCVCSESLLRLWSHGRLCDGRHGEKLDQRAYTTPLSHPLQGRRQVSRTGTTWCPFPWCLVAGCVVSLHPARETRQHRAVGVVAMVKTNIFSVAAQLYGTLPTSIMSVGNTV